MAKKSKYTYHGHEKVIVWNEDKNLTPIKYRLPDPPPLHTIEGYGLPPEEQYWRNHPLPPKLAKINSMVYGEDGKTELTNRMKVEMLEKDPEFYREEIEYIVKEWERRENGYWFFNNGVPTMIIGDHYFYLQWWPIDGALPDYRNRDRRWFWFWLMVEHDDDCFGFNNPKQRREGATKKVCLVRWNRAAMNFFYTTGLQSKDENHASETHFLEIYEVSRYVPFFFQPITDNAQNVWKEIRFYAPRSKNHSDFGEEGLSSFIDFRDSGAKAYDGTKRWLIHNDEAGKGSQEIDINERVRIQIPCLTNIVRNSPKKGKMVNTSTTGEMELGGGKKFKELCDASDYHKRNANKMTTSGLYNLFQPATEGMEGVDPHTKIPFIDKYGNANEEAIRKFLMAKREDNRAAGKMADYIEECRQYPLEYNDCWKTSARQCIFNMIKIEDRLDHFRNGHTEKTRGNLKWANGKRDTRVEWEPADNGRWFLSYKFPDPRFANRMTIDGDGCKWPANKSKFIAGGDPYKFDKTKQKGSKGAGVVFWKYDHSIDGGKTDSLTWDSYRFIATYANRPHTLEDYGEDMIMMCVYFGCEMFPEINVDFLYKYFTERGYGGYLYFKFDPNTNKYAQLPGQYTHIKQKQQMFSVLQSYIEHHVHREKHNELIEEWKSLVDEFTDFDLAVASSLALIGAGDSVANYDEEIDKATDIKDYFTRYVYPE